MGQYCEQAVRQRVLCGQADARQPGISQVLYLPGGNRFDIAGDSAGQLCFRVPAAVEKGVKNRGLLPGLFVGLLFVLFILHQIVNLLLGFVQVFASVQDHAYHLDDFIKLFIRHNVCHILSPRTEVLLTQYTTNGNDVQAEKGEGQHE